MVQIHSVNRPLGPVHSAQRIRALKDGKDDPSRNKGHQKGQSKHNDLLKSDEEKPSPHDADPVMNRKDDGDSNPDADERESGQRIDVRI